MDGWCYERYATITRVCQVQNTYRRNQMEIPAWWDGAWEGFEVLRTLLSTFFGKSGCYGRGIRVERDKEPDCMSWEGIYGDLQGNCSKARKGINPNANYIKWQMYWRAYRLPSGSSGSSLIREEPKIRLTYPSTYIHVSNKREIEEPSGRAQRQIGPGKLVQEILSCNSQSINPGMI